jgi:hypothetical protein
MLNTKYYGFVDPSGGSSDSFALCIGHFDYAKNTVVVDALREVRAPLSPELATVELTKVLNYYHVDTVTGDHYAGNFPAEQFSRCGIRYEQSKKSKSELYVDLLPLINSRRIELLDHPTLINQLSNLERKTTRGGKDSIDNTQGLHDDVDMPGPTGGLMVKKIQTRRGKECVATSIMKVAVQLSSGRDQTNKWKTTRPSPNYAATSSPRRDVARGRAGHPTGAFGAAMTNAECERELQEEWRH